jgi:hypothetical protein
MTAFEESQLAFATSLEDALAANKIAGPVTILVTEDGMVMAIPAGGSVFDIVMLEMDPALYLTMMDRLAELKDAASAIGLETCAAE